MLSERELPQRRLVRVPDVVGLPLRKALLLVQQAGLRASAVLYKESYEEKDMVLEQRPQRGQMVYASEDVSLWVSRDSYIKWLPAIYQRSDATGRNVVRDLLWIIQHLFGSIEQMLENIHLFFDSYETPEHFLPWLAGWSAMLLEPDWPVNKKRRLIKKAMELYRLRGTVRGLKLFISLFTGFEPHLAENEWPFQGFRIGTSSTVGIDTVILPPVDKAHAFVCVMPHQFKDVTSESIVRLHEIIEMEKPAHTTYMLKFEEPRQAVEEREFYRIGISSGINIGQEVVTPLPIDQKTGEPEWPLETTIPEQRPEPSIYELFGTKKRLLPPVENAPKADNAPVEGKEITSSKYGFDDAAREFKLDDIMRELLARAGMGDSTTVVGDGTPHGDGSGGSDGSGGGGGSGNLGGGGGAGGSSGNSGGSSGNPGGSSGNPSGSSGNPSGSSGNPGGSSGNPGGSSGNPSGSSGNPSGSSGNPSGSSGNPSGSSGHSSGSSGNPSASSGHSSGSSGNPSGSSGNPSGSSGNPSGSSGPSSGSSGSAGGSSGSAGGSGGSGTGSAVGSGAGAGPGRPGRAGPGGSDAGYGRAGGGMKVTGGVAGGGRGPRVEIDVDPLSEFEGILSAAEAKLGTSGSAADSAATDAPSESAPSSGGGKGLAGLSDAPTAILGEDAAAKAHSVLGVRRPGGPRIEVEIDKQEIERDPDSAPSSGDSPGSGGKPGSGRDDSRK